MKVEKENCVSVPRQVEKEECRQVRAEDLHQSSIIKRFWQENCKIACEFQREEITCPPIVHKDVWLRNLNLRLNPRLLGRWSRCPAARFPDRLRDRSVQTFRDRWRDRTVSMFPVRSAPTFPSKWRSSSATRYQGGRTLEKCFNRIISF